MTEAMFILAMVAFGVAALWAVLDRDIKDAVTYGGLLALSWGLAMALKVFERS